ncbi:MAG: NAD(P)-binding domain-containing protein, partial [Oscillospiraceae bacterium]|nr:NAD(P)-binding domain-containing protein [Oscillospiraceae bacterium]
IMGKTLGVVGLGAIGVGVANAARHMGMDVMGYDPFISVDAAWGLSRGVKRCHDLKAMFETCDYISLHVPLNADTRGMINSESMAGVRDGVRIINFARGELVADDDMLAMLDSGKAACYVTDFPNAKLVKHKNVVPIPHLGASTPESENNCAVMAADQLSDYIRYGIIYNSVNFPDVALPWAGSPRLCVLHKNIPNMLTNISSVFGSLDINIENFINRSKGEYAYTMLDATEALSAAQLERLGAVDGIIRARLIGRS